MELLSMDHRWTPAVYVLALIGFAVVMSKVISFNRMLLDLFVLPGMSLRKFGSKGSWAIVTGASDGIGREFAIQLARRGFNVLLVSRTASKLEAVATEISKVHKTSPDIRIETHAIDFAHATDDDWAEFEEVAAPLAPVILVNNAGLSHSIPVPFIETAVSEMRDIVAVNDAATLRVTRIVAPGMVTRRKGLILTVASFGGILPTPLLATYSGSKAFLQQWSAALGAELERSGVVVRCVQSYLVTSAMSKVRKSTALVPTPAQFVTSTLGSLGRAGGAGGVGWTSTPFWSHAIMHWGLREVVGTAGSYVTRTNMRMHENIRKRALRKMEREGKKAE